MENNDVLRRLRYTFDFGDDKMIKIFANSGMEVTRSEISNWLKDDKDEAFQLISDEQFATFLNGLIIENRGKKEGVEMIAEKKLNNNLVFRKLRIALNLKTIDILHLFDAMDIFVSEHELSAFFRKPTQKQYRPCKDQFLRNFLGGLQKKHRG